jgi:hypothetical protein
MQRGLPRSSPDFNDLLFASEGTAAPAAASAWRAARVPVSTAPAIAAARRLRLVA